MQRIFLTLALLIILLGSGFYYFLTIALPTQIDARFTSIFKNAGFEDVRYDSADIRFKAARFTGITLDKEGLSTIETLDISYTPILHDIQNIKIYKLNLIGDFYDEIIKIAGWKNSNFLHAALPHNFNSILFQDSRIAVLTEKYGGVNFDFDIQARENQGQIIFDGRAETRQKNLSLTSNVTGLINPDTSWQARFEIERGKFNMGTLKAMRLSGKSTASGTAEQPPKIEAQFQAGGFNFDGTPWQNASGRFNGNFDTFSIFLDMKSLGAKDLLELGLHIKKYPHPEVSGLLHAGNITAIQDFAATHKGSFLDTLDLEAANEDNGVSLEFTLEPEIIFGDQDVNAP